MKVKNIDIYTLLCQCAHMFAKMCAWFNRFKVKAKIKFQYFKRLTLNCTEG